MSFKVRLHRLLNFKLFSFGMIEFETQMAKLHSSDDCFQFRTISAPYGFNTTRVSLYIKQALDCVFRARPRLLRNNQNLYC